jgi:hypothetical protein
MDTHSDPSNGIYRLLDVNSQHVSEEGKAWLEEYAKEDEYGWCVGVRDDEDLAEMPATIAAIFRLAVEHGCHWVLIDVGGMERRSLGNWTTENGWYRTEAQGPVPDEPAG